LVGFIISNRKLVQVEHDRLGDEEANDVEAILLSPFDPCGQKELDIEEKDVSIFYP
jgi:hypothetical protein